MKEMSWAVWVSGVVASRWKKSLRAGQGWGGQAGCILHAWALYRGLWT